MTSSVPNCDICSSQHKSVSAEIWCLECGESLCTDCKRHHGLSRGSRNHETLPISEYNNLPDFIVQVGNSCSKHNERFIVYCNDHGSPGCGKCAIEEHRSCKNVTDLEQVVKNVKSSSALSELEEELSDMSKNMQKLQADRQKNLKSLHEQKLEIERYIGAQRAKINDHLDKMQSQLINDLYKNEKLAREKIESVLKSLSARSDGIKQLAKYIEAVKKHGSCLQTFLALGELEKRRNQTSKKVLDMTEAGEFDNATLKHQEQELTCSSDLASIAFGKIVTEVSPSNVKLITRKEKQAQIHVPVAVSASYSIESVSVKLNRSITTRCQNTSGCVLLPDGRSLFTCYYLDIFTSFDKDGNLQNIKQLKSSPAFDITYSEESGRCFISPGGRRGFNEINLNDGYIKHIETDDYSNKYGVVVKHDKLIYCVQSEGVCERKLSDGSVRVIVSDPRLPRMCYITEYRDHLYFTNNEDHSVTCCGMGGRLIWKFTNDALKRPSGISVDNYGNVYVVDDGSDNVVVISGDGQRHREILSREDGLEYPQVICFQRSTNQLLVANTKEKAFLFDVSFS